MPDVMECFVLAGVEMTQMLADSLIDIFLRIFQEIFPLSKRGHFFVLS